MALCRRVAARPHEHRDKSSSNLEATRVMRRALGDKHTRICGYRARKLFELHFLFSQKQFHFYVVATVLLCLLIYVFCASLFVEPPCDDCEKSSSRLSTLGFKPITSMEQSQCSERETVNLGLTYFEFMIAR